MAQSRDEAQNYCLQQKQAVSEAHAKESQLTLQIEGLKRRLEELHQVNGNFGWKGDLAGSCKHPRQRIPRSALHVNHSVFKCASFRLLARLNYYGIRKGR